MHQTFFYKAFISYSHEDHKHAVWLHKALETYSIPKHLRHSSGSKSLAPIFRDRAELPANANLTEIIKTALAKSEFLIVVCSPAAAASQWVGLEIMEFQRLHGDTNILGIIVGGCPSAEETHKQCFPHAMRFVMGKDGLLSAVPREPIAADLRAGGDGKRLVKLKLVAGLLGVGLDQIVQRDSKRRHRAMTFITASAVTAMLVMGYLMWAAVDSRRQAEARRAESEDLVAFMLGDLRQKLEPVGRLELLGAVSGKILAHYAKESANDMSNSNLQQKAKALTLLGDIENQRGDKKAAYTTVEQASAVTSELVRRQPSNQQYIFDHAQNEFWRGQVMMDSGNNTAADQAFLNYENLAQRLVLLAPNNFKWQLEVAYAQLNRGALLLEENQPALALAKFEQSYEIQQRMPSHAINRTQLKEKANTLVWKADALNRLLRLPEAAAVLDTDISEYQDLLKQDPKDEQINGALQSVRINKALITAALGNTAEAIHELESTLVVFGYLVNRDPQNQDWRERLISTQHVLAEMLLENNKAEQAKYILGSASKGIETFEKNSKDSDFWRQKLKVKNTCLSSVLLFSQKRYALAVATMDAAIESSMHTRYSIKADDMVSRNLGLMFYIQGEIGNAMNDQKMAHSNWQQAFEQLKPYKYTGEARDRDTLARAEYRLGNIEAALKIKNQLDQNGYKYPAYLLFWKNRKPETAMINNFKPLTEHNHD